MATLTRRVEVVEERTGSLEDILAAFMARTDASMARMDASMARMDEAMARTDASMERTGEATVRTDERIGRLELVVERMERNIERREQEGAREREEAARERQEIREQADRDRRKMDERFGALADSIDRMEQEGAREREAAAREREAAACERKEMKEQAARERKEMNKRWGELANKMGTVVEDIVAPSIRRLAHEVFDCGEQQYFGTRVSVNRSDDRSRKREFDALYVGSRAVLLNQTKSTPRTHDAREFVQFLESGEFALYYPRFRELPIVPAFSSLSIPEDMVRYLTRRGIYAIAMGDEAMQVLNLEAVRRWRSAP